MTAADWERAYAQYIKALVDLDATIQARDSGFIAGTHKKVRAADMRLDKARRRLERLDPEWTYAMRKRGNF